MSKIILKQGYTYKKDGREMYQKAYSGFSVIGLWVFLSFPFLCLSFFNVKK